MVDSLAILAPLIKLVSKVELMPGAERLVRHLHKHRIPFGVATSSHSGPYDSKTSRHREVFSLFDTIVRGDDSELKKGKPAPDIFLMCASRLPNPPTVMSKCLVFEDAVIGASFPPRPAPILAVSCAGAVLSGKLSPHHDTKFTQPHMHTIPRTANSQD